MEIKRIDRLPPRAWLANLVDGARVILCGSEIDVFDDGIVEGCWDGPFADYRFDQAENFFGSGLMSQNGKITVVGPTHTLEALYVLETRCGSTVSNSLPFLLEHNDIELPETEQYCRKFASIVQGVSFYRQVIYEASTITLWRFVFADIVIDGDHLTHDPKICSAQFANFRTYNNYLLATLRALFENAENPMRNRPMTPLTSLSSGYDSAACASLASSVGCTEAATLAFARGGEIDSGRAVADSLGIKVHEIQPSDTDEPFSEAEFLASGTGGEDFPLIAFRDLLPGRVFLTGFHGDKVWDLNAEPSSTIERGDISGTALTEFRLRIGFTNVPVPFIGVLRHDDLARIGKSKEMHYFHVGTTYDRPIPRRIVEEKGVLRKEFGQKKRAASMLFFQSDAFLSGLSRKDFEQFVARHITLSQRLRQASWLARFRLVQLIRYVFKSLRLPGQRFVSRLIVGDWRLFEHSSPVYSDLMFHWSLDKVRRRYRLD